VNGLYGLFCFISGWGVFHSSFIGRCLTSPIVWSLFLCCCVSPSFLPFKKFIVFRVMPGLHRFFICDHHPYLSCMQVGFRNAVALIFPSSLIRAWRWLRGSWLLCYHKDPDQIVFFLSYVMLVASLPSYLFMVVFGCVE